MPLSTFSQVTARRLGAMLRTNLDKTCTHVICARDTKDAALELAVKSGNCLIRN